jgi:hypothetical protein
MNITQLSEHLKDVPQNTLVGYAKSPNSVVPQFLALAEIQRRQQLQTAGAGQPPARTVAEDVLDQANPQPMQPQMQAQVPPQPQAPMAQQLPENQPGVASLPTGMPQGMAGGGIVAFASGGDAEDDEDEDIEMAKLFPQKSGINFEEMLASIPGGIRGLMNKLPQSYEATKATTATTTTAEPKLENIEGFLAKLQHLESRGRHFDSAGKILTSPKGAEGIMQVMPRTQLNPGYGVAPAQNKSPEELERVGRDYGVAMYNEFKDPKLAAMAYNWGPGNVKKWLESGRKLPIPRETIQYASNFAKGGIAHFADAGLVGPEGSPMEQYLSENPPPEQEPRRLTAAEKQAQFREKQLSKLQKSISTTAEKTTPSESTLGMRGLKTLLAPIAEAPIISSVIPAIGGALSYGATKFLENRTPEELEQLEGYGADPSGTSFAAAIINAANRQPTNSSVPALVPKSSAPPVNTTSREQAVGQNRDPYRSAPALQFNYPPQGGIGPSDTDLQRYGMPVAPKEVPIPRSKSDEYFDQLAQDIQERAAQAKEEGDMNKYLAIMQAGFAMMGGTSPYAMTNIGKGAEQGISTYGALRKQSLDTLKDIGLSRRDLAKYQAAKESATERLQEERLYRELALGQRGAMSAADLAEKARGHTIAERQHAQQNLLKIEQILGAAYDKNVNNIGKPASERDAYIYGNPLFKKAAIDSGLDLSSLGGQSGFTVIAGGKTYSFPDQASADAFKKKAGI